MKQKDALKVNTLCGNFMSDMVKLASNEWGANLDRVYNDRAHNSIIMLSRYMMMAYTKGIEKFSDSELFYMTLHMKEVISLIEELDEKYNSMYKNSNSELFTNDFLLLGGALESMVDIIVDDADDAGSRFLMHKDSEEYETESYEKDLSDEDEFVKFLAKFNMTPGGIIDCIPTKKLVDVLNESRHKQIFAGVNVQISTDKYFSNIATELERRGVKTRDKDGNILEKIDVGYNID